MVQLSNGNMVEEATPLFPDAAPDRVQSGLRRRGAWIAVAMIAFGAVLALAGGSTHAPQGLTSMRGKAAVSLAEAPAVHSLGVSSLSAQAKAVQAKAERSSKDLNAIDKAVDNAVSASNYFEEQAKAQSADAEAMKAEMKALTSQMKSELASADEVRSMAKHDMGAASALAAQADKDLTSASEILEAASGASIRQIAQQQVNAAKQNKARAEKQMDDAKKMMAEAVAMKARADEEQALIKLLVTDAGLRDNASEAILALGSNIKERLNNLTGMEKNVTGAVSDAKANAEKLAAKVKVETAKMVKTSEEIADSEAKEKALQKEIAKQNHSIHAAKVLYNSSQEEMGVAKSMLEQLKNQSQAFSHVAAIGGRTKDAAAFNSLVAEELQANKVAKAEAAQEIDRAAAMSAKATRVQSQAQDALAAAMQQAMMAKKVMETAAATQSKINAPDGINSAITGQIRAMMDGVSEAVAASEAIEVAVQTERDAFAAAKAQAASEKASAEDLEGKAAGLGSKSAATSIASLASKEEQSAAALVAEGERRKSAMHMLEALGKDMGEQAQQLQAIAKKHEDQFFQETYDRRICMDLPGVRLTGDAAEFERLVGADKAPQTVQECSEKCRKYVACQQAVFSEDNKGCYLMYGRSTAVTEFTDGYNSSVCGEPEEKADMADLISKVYAQKPWIPETVECAWADENCLNSKCCNNIVCDWKFNCHGYQCYQRDEFFASCKDGAPAGFNPKPIGGQRNVREIAKAKKGILIQGTSLFCFSVVMWHAAPTKPFYDTEAQVANNWMQNGLGIMQCDDHIVFDGKPAPKSSWGSFSNIDAFIAIWDEVKQDGRYKNHDWVVKVDTDAVFFPHRLKMHLANLGTPQGSRVYLRNNAYRFQFMGAIEIMTRQALDWYYLHAERCAVGGGGHSGGEDFFMKSCLEGIGVDFQTDFGLLHDRYAGQEGCADGWAVAFHFYKKVFSWNACHQMAVDSEPKPPANTVVFQQK